MDNPDEFESKMLSAAEKLRDLMKERANAIQNLAWSSFKLKSDDGSEERFMCVLATDKSQLAEASIHTVNCPAKNTFDFETGKRSFAFLISLFIENGMPLNFLADMFEEIVENIIETAEDSETNKTPASRNKSLH